MAHDRDYFRRRAAEARFAAFQKDDGEDVEVAGHLALAYAALARRRAARTSPETDSSLPVDPIDASVADEPPMMLRD